MLLHPAPLAAGLTLALLVPPAVAQFSNVAPFVGTSWERFEGWSSQPCVPARVFENQADLCSADGTSNIATSLGAGSSCTVVSHGPPRMATCGSSGMVLTFDDWTTKFGCYFESHVWHTLDVATIRFFDTGGLMVFEETFAVPANCTWSWHGWDTGGVQVKTIEIMSGNSFGGGLGIDDLRATIGPPTTGDPFCFCDRSVNCPVPGFYGAGCINSESPSGARLYATGRPRVSASTVVLRADYLPYFGPGVFFQGDQSVNGGAGTPFGPGLLCVTLNTLRLETTFWPGGATSTHTTVDLPAVYGNSIFAGQTKVYQFWYREGTFGYCSGGWNLTNALRITWVP